MRAISIKSLSTALAVAVAGIFGWQAKAGGELKLCRSPRDEAPIPPRTDERRIGMHRRFTEDTPSYAAETIASAQVNGSRLAASSGLFIVLLIAMTLIEAPIPHRDRYIHMPEDRQSTALVSLHAYGSAADPVAPIGAEPSSKTAAGGTPWCLHSRAPDEVTLNPGGAAHPRAG